MATVRTRPGPAAAAAFRFGMVAAAVAGLAALAAFYWVGSLSLPFVGYTLLLLYPVYLVVVASLLSVWLGYSKDATALRPVQRDAQ